MSPSRIAAFGLPSSVNARSMFGLRGELGGEGQAIEATVHAAAQQRSCCSRWSGA